ncbi:bifunctional adenosylcobinamide kinase/adenosylcobinamide-phosphate guanylyltransferase [Thiocapsa imhoffii]|uniref:Bifunctional adenosylcobalamin biosynthesis protein n=1 Tax=Thiocapsa imhoffii TaxID=382777 RepID=A0A9X0WFB6_9GAMM|nr:bifunctional adenosylcobinamide kinase/adenosylcobinamide-phosphate guanylyltransferase [Thiocapsa imhoffii]MBK1643117.1 bifunctional adenosylcobinamide kinase/adenosylcobinamide-phosphate guanylyltransferase [Thiocapsa imhoffii]
MRTLILGGVRSGKSRLAEQLAHASGQPVVYVATAQAKDAEMAQRIAAHRARRSPTWRLIEEPYALAEVIAREAGAQRCVLVDCVTLWLTNWLMRGDDDALAAQIRALLEVVTTTAGTLILVSNETNLGVIPLGELSRRFVDVAGTLHQDLAARCDQVILTVAGIPLTIKECEA